MTMAVNRRGWSLKRAYRVVNTHAIEQRDRHFGDLSDLANAQSATRAVPRRAAACVTPKIRESSSAWARISRREISIAIEMPPGGRRICSVCSSRLDGIPPTYTVNYRP